ncbi:hypothetical protein ACJ41O_005759 [Fusarium nematophilum]
MCNETRNDAPALVPDEEVGIFAFSTWHGNNPRLTWTDQIRDHGDSDSVYESDAASSTQSISSSILDYRRENGRTYHGYKDGKYSMPNDEVENERLGIVSLSGNVYLLTEVDLQHHLFLLTFENKLGLSPPNDHESKVKRVLDLGTGTGIWAVDYADEHPEAEVIGIDLSPTQPEFVPPNIQFIVDDIDEEWNYSKPFDYIHSRMMNLSVKDWKDYIQKIYDNLEPDGYCELQEVDSALKSDDGTLKPESQLTKWCELLNEGVAKMGRAMVSPPYLKELMLEVGFVDVVDTHFKWPSNRWPRDKKFKILGHWNNINTGYALEGAVLAPLTRVHGWTREEVGIFAARARTELNDPAIHAYWPINVSVDKRDRMLCIRRDLVQIEEYANSGCQSCLVIHKITQFFGLKRTATAKRCNVYLRLPIDPGNPEVSFWPSGIESGVIVQLYTHISDLKTWRNIRPLPEICPDHMSPESISFIKACLRTCRESHPLCRKTEARLPTRVLDIGDTRDGHIRLIESLGFMAAEYVALSYCWGNAVAMRTLVENLETMKSGIAISELPPAYLDAVLLTRQLGIRYLWIDALCIIQDSEEDWEKECSVMCDTYSRATLTVAAASSTSAAEHFLRPLLRPQSYAAQYNPNVFSERIRDGEDSVWIRARAILKTGAHWRWGHSDNERPLLEPLTKRGWTLQERLLSTRLLSIAATEMEWTCKEAVFCECRSRLNHQREFGRMPLWRITEASDAFNFWHKVVENYSKRELTKPRDKLPAISAVASVIQRRIESNYAAGLWTDNIDLDLLWRRSDSVRETPQSEYIAPTFSWASIHGEIDYYCFRNGKERYDKASSVLSVETNGCTESHLGRVESGQLTIRGPLAQGVMAALSEDGLLSVLVGGKSLVFGIDAQLQALTIPETSRSIPR